MSDVRVIPEAVQDVVRELGNIGIGCAATALSELINQPIQTSSSDMEPIEQDEDYYKELHKQVIGILYPFDSDLYGYALFIMEKEDVSFILRVLMNSDSAFTELDKESSGMLREVTGIMISSYLRSIAEAVHVSLRIQLPAITWDMRGSILNEAVSMMLSQEDDAFRLEHSFRREGSEYENKLLFMISKKSIDKILDKLEVKV